ncbi:alpha-amylase family glycosyl hydrolase [Trueperella pyogenes]
MTNAGFTSIGQYRDLETLNHHAEAMASGANEQELLRAFAVKSRDNARYPMSWDDSEQAGFTTGVPWLPVHRNHVEVNAAAARNDQESVFHHYRRLIELRHTNRVVRDGVFALLHRDDEQLFSYTRSLKNVGELLVLANMSSQPCPLPVDCRVSGEVLLATHQVRAAECLAPWESRVLALESCPAS